MKKSRDSRAKKGGVRWVAVSGGFDPIHIGHVRMFEEARRLGDKLVIILNNDNWLRAKKGYVFMPQKERAELLRAFPSVDRVYITDHKKLTADTSVSRALAKLKPAFFANGGDRKSTKDIPEAAVCKKLGIAMAFNVGKGGKVQSSSWMISAARRPAAETRRPWGKFFGWDAGKEWYLKTVYVAAGKRLSLQYHNHRSELWILAEGDATATIEANGKSVRVPLIKGQVFSVPTRTLHRLESKRGGVIVEVALGEFDEEDIVRLHDDYGRLSS